MFRFFKHRLPAWKFKNSSLTETPVGPGRPSRAWVRTDYNLASVSPKGRKFGVRPVLGKRRRDWTLGNTGRIPGPVAEFDRSAQEDVVERVGRLGHKDIIIHVLPQSARG